MKISEKTMETRIDRYSGSLVMTRVFEIQRNKNSESHIVRIEVSESGTPQYEKCDCKGFQFKKHCSHIDEIYNVGLLKIEEARIHPNAIPAARIFIIS